MRVYFRLEGEERKVVLNAFREMVIDELLEKCLSGKTQNPNESLHAKVWNKLPKTRSYQLLTVQQSVCLSALQHNFGYYDGCPLSKFGFGEVNPSTTKYLKHQDKERLRHSIGVSRRRSKRKSDESTPVAKRGRRKQQRDLQYSPGAY